MDQDTAPRLKDALHHVLEGRDLSVEAAEAAMGEIMAGKATEGRIAGYLVALRMKGETPQEVVGSARAMRAAATTISPSRRPLVDTCGTGGDGSGTFNISTASALVVAAAGGAVAKHGNRSVSSQCGSADVLLELGIPIDGEPAQVQASVDQHGFGFLMAPRFHGAIKHAMPARITLASRTIFNLLGPLCNPALAPRQVMGVFSESVLQLAAEALQGLGTEHAFVVHSRDGLDELSLSAPTHVIEVTGSGLRRYEVSPGDFGLAEAPARELEGGDAAMNARILTGIFAGEAGPRRDVVLMNAAMALVAAGLADGPKAGVERAAAAIDDGSVRALVGKLRGVGE
ncbi:MAG: anthranilate phosphoribosyltransferase [Gemmatimonadota bacterium]|nr:MAG: anthranilate phosphoribosyltransferase [Gemmatimonadota bacterium]